MKKLTTLTIIALFGISVSSLAQVAKTKYYIPKGTFLMTGSISGNYIKKDNAFELLKRSATISIAENNGFFVMDNLSVGITVGYEFSFKKEVGPFATPTGPLVRRTYNHTVAPGIFLRYYKMFNQKFGIFGQFNGSCLVAFGDVQSNDAVYTTKDHYVGFDFGVSPRLVYFLTPKLGLEAGFGSIRYSYLKDMNSGKDSHGGGFALNPDLNLGLSFYLGKGVQAK